MKATHWSLLAAVSGSIPACAVSLTQISTTFNSPIGIDYHEPTQSVIASVNYFSGGTPNNLERILLDGSYTQFSAVSGLTDELKIATVRSGNVGGFSTGEVFTGTGNDGQIIRISPDGSSFSYINLPGTGHGLMRGSLYLDRTGVYGGDLITVTTGGEVWRINSSGSGTFIADVDTHLEGLMTVPNNTTLYGPLAGKIIAGAEEQGFMYVFDNSGYVDTYDFGINIEDIDLIEPGENFFGINFGTSRILGAPASDFASMANDILLTQEMPAGGSALFHLEWNGSGFSANELVLDSGSEVPAQWEHVTFAPAGIVEIQPTVPEASTWVAGVGLVAAVAGTALRQRRQR